MSVALYGAETVSGVGQAAGARELRDKYITQEWIDRLIRDARAELEAAHKKSPVKQIAKLEAEREKIQAEQKKLVSAIANGIGDLHEIGAELNSRRDRLQRLEANLAALRRTPDRQADLLRQLDSTVRAKLEGFRETLASAEIGEARAVIDALFPGGLTFDPVKLDPSDMPKDLPRRRGRRRTHVWAVEGVLEAGISAAFSVTPPGLEPGISA